jgi:hypothetical protein
LVLGAEDIVKQAMLRDKRAELDTIASTRATNEAKKE